MQMKLISDLPAEKNQEGYRGFFCLEVFCYDTATTR